MVTQRHFFFQSHIPASPAQVFTFHERPDAFALLTPWWSGARVIRPAASLQPGETALLRLGPGPLAQDWEAVHEVYEPPTRFVEAQLRGPFAFWRHQHLVRAWAGGALLRDEITYGPPGGPLAPLVDAILLRPFLRCLFAYRHAATRRAVLSLSGGPKPKQRS